MRNALPNVMCCLLCCSSISGSPLLLLSLIRLLVVCCLPCRVNVVWLLCGSSKRQSCSMAASDSMLVFTVSSIRPCPEATGTALLDTPAWQSPAGNAMNTMNVSKPMMRCMLLQYCCKGYRVSSFSSISSGISVNTWFNIPTDTTLFSPSSSNRPMLKRK